MVRDFSSKANSEWTVFESMWRSEACGSGLETYYAKALSLEYACPSQSQQNSPCGCEDRRVGPGPLETAVREGLGKRSNIKAHSACCTEYKL